MGLKCVIPKKDRRKVGDRGTLFCSYKEKRVRIKNGKCCEQRNCYMANKNVCT